MLFSKPPVTISARIAELVARSNLSIREIELIGCLPKGYLRHVISGKRGNPSAVTLMGLLFALDLDWDAFVGVNDIHGSDAGDRKTGVR